jgi:hypothetical protein
MARFNLANKLAVDAPSGRSAWELFLLGTGVSESTCASLLAGRSRKGRVIRAWVREHYSTRYVPESILDTLGLRKSLRLRWQGED